MSKRKQNLIVAVSLIMLLMPQTVMAMKVFNPDRETIREITKGINTPEKKLTAVGKLISIVKDEKGGIRLRRLAAEKLGQLRAVEAEETLKTLVDNFEWGISKEQSDLNRVIHLSYWQIKVSREPDIELQNNMLIELVGVIPFWPIDELSNRGVKKALPKIIEGINSGLSGRRAELRIKLCTTKIELLTNNFTRHEALYKALKMEDTDDQYQRLKKWATEELGKLDSDESRKILISFAKELENKYIDSRGNRIKVKGDYLRLRDGSMYRYIIKILKCYGFSDDKIKDHGLNPKKNFRSHDDVYDEDCSCYIS